MHDDLMLGRPAGSYDPDCGYVAIEVAVFLWRSPAVDLRNGSPWVFRAVPSLLVEERLQVVTKLSSLFFWPLWLLFFFTQLDQNVVGPFSVFFFLLNVQTI